MCQQAQMIECLTAPMARPWPRRGRSRRYWAARYTSLVRLAAVAASVSAVSSHLEPWRDAFERRLPAERLLPGHCPAQLARWRAEGKRLMSAPVSATITSAVRRWTPGIVH